MADGLTDAQIEQALRAAPEERWQDLWAAVRALGAEPEAGRWDGGQTTNMLVDGVERPVMHMPYVVYADAALEVVAKVAGLGASRPFDWQAWGGLARYWDGGLETAPVAEAVRMVTAIVRADRFSEGTLLASIEQGVFGAAVERLRRWYDEERPPAAHRGPDPTRAPDW